MERGGNENYKKRMDILEKYGTLKFTAYDRELRTEKLDPSKWPMALPYRINIGCEYIRPLYKKYKDLVAPGIGPLSDAQRFDFECMIIIAAKSDMSPEEKIKAVEREIDSIKNNPWDYLPDKSTPFRNLFPARAKGTIYEGKHSFAVKEPLELEEYRKLFE